MSASKGLGFPTEHGWRVVSISAPGLQALAVVS